MLRNIINKCLRNPVIARNFSSVYYEQGQSPEPRVREYFYFIDHNGMLFLDDAKMKNFTSCYKDKKFLKFFFGQMRKNNTGRYQDKFPYISLCGKERNFIRCDDVPVVFTHLISQKELGKPFLTYGYAGDLLKWDFLPDKIFMLPESGRVYHPCSDKCGGIGLLRSKLAIELSRNLVFAFGEDHPPTHLSWNGSRYELDQEWYYIKRKVSLAHEY